MDKALLFKLSSGCCITGDGSAADIVAKEAAKYAAVRRDKLGNVIAEMKKPAEGQPNILLEAHLDEIGFIVTAIDEDGFLHFSSVGGPDHRILLGEEVTIHSKNDVYGVICCRPPHLSTKEDRKKVPDLDETAIDIGFSHDEAVKIVNPGDFITFRRTPRELLNGYITGKSLDNRAGCATVLRCMELLKGKVNCGLTAAFTLHEELGGQGSKTAAFGAAPTHALVVDVSFAFTPDAPRDKCGDLGKGPMIGISPLLSREVTSMLFDLAKEKDIPYQTEVMGGSTGTNADTITTTRDGVKTGLISVPLRYMHTASEVIIPDDIENTARLMAAAVERIGGANNENA